MKYGVYPFWFWNGLQEEAEIERQLKLMRSGNCRGAVVHARSGNEIPYLSERWFGLIRHCCVIARQLDMKLWLYDEDGFPSGNAGGLVQKNRPDLEQQALCFLEEFAPHEGCSTELFSDDPHCLLIRNNRHIDLFHPESIQRFLAFTHEQYAAHVGDFFGDTIEAIYTDDESFLMHYIPGWPYSPVLAEEYEKRFGAPFRNILPALASDASDSAEIRGNYLALAGELFLDNFIRPQIEWCHKYNLTYLGHLCGDEGPLHYSLRRYGSPMPFYRMEDVPSIDDFLCDLDDQRYLAHPFSEDGMRHLPIGARTTPLLNYKLAASAAEQFANGRFSAETLTFLGWEVTPDFIQKQMLFELGMGVNFITHHAYYYRVDGGTEKDCPPSYFFQQPYYPIFAEQNKVWTRIADLLARGKSTAKHLVIWPETLLSLAGGSDIAEISDDRTPVKLAEERLMDLLLKRHREHIAFDFGEESMLTVRDGKLCVGNCLYDTFERIPGIPLLPETEQRLAQLPGGQPQPCVGFDEPEILVRARDVEGFRELYLLNLAGRDVPLRFASEDEFALYDPVGDRVCFRGNALPEGALLRDGVSAMILPGSWDAAEIPFAESVYACHDFETVPLYEAERTGEWTKYTGTVSRTPAILELETAHAAHLAINGKSAGTIFGKPHLLRIGRFGSDGVKEVTVTLYRPLHSGPPPVPRLRVSPK